jgi:hypothetical protein
MVMYFHNFAIGDRICGLKMEIIEEYQRTRTLELLQDYDHGDEYGYLGHQLIVSRKI